jgi:hypothetical protein
MKKVNPNKERDMESQRKRSQSKGFVSRRSQVSSSVESMDKGPDQKVAEIIKFRNQPKDSATEKRITLKDLCIEDRLKIGKMISTLEEQKVKISSLEADIEISKVKQKTEAQKMTEDYNFMLNRYTTLEAEHKKTIRLLKFYEGQINDTNYAQPRLEMSQNINPNQLAQKTNTIGDGEGPNDNSVNNDFRTNNSSNLNSANGANDSLIRIRDQSSSRRGKERQLLSVKTGSTLNELTKESQQVISTTQTIPELKELTKDHQDLELTDKNFGSEEDIRILDPQLAMKSSESQIRPIIQIFSKKKDEDNCVESKFTIYSVYGKVFQKSDLEKKVTKQPKQEEVLSKEKSADFNKKSDFNERKLESKPQQSKAMEILKSKKQMMDSKKQKDLVQSKEDYPSKGSNSKFESRNRLESSDSSDDDSYAIAMKVLRNQNLKTQNKNPNLPVNVSIDHKKRNEPLNMHIGNAQSQNYDYSNPKDQKNMHDLPNQKFSNSFQTKPINEGHLIRLDRNAEFWKFNRKKPAAASNRLR